MAENEQPSYTDLVYEVLKTTGRPLTVQEILEEVHRRRPITSRDPKGTVRYVLTQGRQLVSLGANRYGYLPYLVNGSLLRLPLTEDKPANRPLSYPNELLFALWPSFDEAEKRRLVPAVRANLRDGPEISLSIQLLARGIWGSPMPEALCLYLIRNGAAAGDSLLIRVIDSEAGDCEMWFESRWRRDENAITSRNRELADAAYKLISRTQPYGTLDSNLAVALLGRGFYHSDVVPEPLDWVLGEDPRFVRAGWSWALAGTITAEEIEARNRVMADFFQSLQDMQTELSAGASVRGTRKGMERVLSDIEAAVADREFESTEEATAFINQVLSQGEVPRRDLGSALETAQDIAYDAWDAPTRRERIRLAKKALDISPDCADAYVILGEEAARSEEEALSLYEQGVAAGERALGKDTFEEEAGHFWGILKTRPYMRARFYLADTLWQLERREEATEHFWDMLRLNPNDNQAARYSLLCCLLETQDEAQIRRLLALYPGDAMAVWKYGQALLSFQTEGDTVRSRKLLVDAVIQNPFVCPYLLGVKELPEVLPETIGFGDESEAVACAAQQIVAWLNTPGAIAWLASRVT